MTQQERQGWVLVGGLFVTLLLIFGSGYNTAPIFLPALIKYFGWKRAEVSLLPSAVAASAGVSPTSPVRGVEVSKVGHFSLKVGTTFR